MPDAVVCFVFGVEEWRAVNGGVYAIVEFLLGYWNTTGSFCRHCVQFLLGRSVRPTRVFFVSRLMEVQSIFSLFVVDNDGVDGDDWMV